MATISLFLFLFFIVPFLTQADVKLQTTTRCLGGSVDLQCAVSKVINITNAVYGRTSKHAVCKDDSARTHILCFSYEKQNNIKRMCNLKNACKIDVTRNFFGDACDDKGGEYLNVTYQCHFANTKSTSAGRVAIMPNLIDPFARTDKKYVPRNQYLTRIAVNHSVPIRFPLTFVIDKVKGLKVSSLDSKEIQTKALQDLIADKTVDVKEGDGSCDMAIGGSLSKVQYFCVYSRAGYIFVNGDGLSRLKESISRYQIDVFVKDHANSYSSKTSIVVHVSSRCFPVDYLYRKLKRHCPTKMRSKTHTSNNEKWPISSYKVAIGNGVVIGKIQLDTNLTSPLFEGNCSVVVRANGEEYKQMFEYFHTVDLVKGRRTLFYPRVYGKTFSVSFSREIYIPKVQTISVSFYNSNGKAVDFYGKRSVSVVGFPKPTTCPSNACMEYFESWRKSYEAVVKAAVMHCVDDVKMFKVFLSTCQNTPHINVKEAFYFGKEISLRCDGIRTNQYQHIRWYKDNKILTGKDNSHILKISGLDFIQQGFYYCEIDYSDVTVKSNVVLVKFKDAVKTTLYFDIVKKQYDDMVARDGKLNVEVTLKTKIHNLISHDASTFTSVSMPTITEGFSVWLKVQIIAYSQLKSKETSVSYYDSLGITNDFKELKPFKVRESSTLILDRDMCLPGITGTSSSYGEFRWNYTISNSSETTPCTFGSQTASRKCVGNFTVGAFWLEPNVKQCEYGNPVTKQLDGLLKNLSSTSVEQTSVQMKQITNTTSTLTAEDTVLIKDIITNIVDSSTDITDKVAENLIDVTSNLMEVNQSCLTSAQYQNHALKSILLDVEQIATKLHKNSSKTDQPVQVASHHIGIASFQPKHDSGGVMTIRAQSESLPSRPFLYNDGEDGRSNDVVFKINIPKSLMTDREKNESINFVVYAKDTLFPIIQRDRAGIRTNKLKKVVQGKIFSLSIGGKHHINLTEDIIYTMKTSTISKDQLKCVYWDYNANGELGGWSSDGCRQLHSGDNWTKCSCNHLTHFAVLFDLDVTSVNQLDKDHELALTVITYIGCALSLTGIFLTLLTLLMFKFLRRNAPSKVLIGMCISLGCLMISFLIFVKRTEPRWLCIVGSASLQYFVLTSFGWMFVEAVMLYLKVVKVVGEYTSNFILKASLVALGLPAVIVAVCMGVRFDDYNNKELCVVSGNVLRYGLLLPTCCIIFFNAIVFILVVISLRKNNKASQRFSQSPDLATQVRIAVSCCTLLGLTWLFGVLAISDARLPFQYLFCIFNSLQGAFIFYFNILRQTRVKEAWMQFLSGHGRSYEPSTTSSHLRKTTQKSSEGEQSPPPLQLSYRQIGEGNNVFNNSLTKSELSFSSYMERNGKR